MSQYQFVAFRAVDRPLSDRELVYARKQSTRAEITRWRLENEYHYGDFRGNMEGLLRHGYDVHLHYANFGIRKMSFRLPGSLPKSVWSPYFHLESLTWKKDSKGPGGILTVTRIHEPDDLEELWSPDEYVDDVVEVRNRLIGGDARVLYLLWLCAATDHAIAPDVVEPPVPGGLADLVEPCSAFLEFFGLDPLVLLAASERTPRQPEPMDHERVKTFLWKGE